MLLPHVEPVIFLPIADRVSVRYPATGMPREAEYHPRSEWSRAGIAVEHLPDWKHDDQYLVQLMYVRYKRRI